MSCLARKKRVSRVKRRARVRNKRLRGLRYGAQDGDISSARAYNRAKRVIVKHPYGRKVEIEGNRY